MGRHGDPSSAAHSSTSGRESFMRNAAAVGWVFAFVAFAACSSDQKSRFGEGAGGGNTGSGTMAGPTGSTLTIMPSGSSTTITNPTTTGSGGMAGAGGGGVVGDPIPDPCMATADCADGGAGYVCTVANKCGKTQGSCTSQSDCMGDSYCCMGA